MVKYPNRAALYEAHNIYRDVMRRFVVRCLKKIQGTTPEQELCRILKLELTADPKVAIDINDFPRIIRDRDCWFDAFSSLFGSKGDMDIRGMTSVISDSRKLWAHPGTEDVDSDSIQMYLSLIAEVLDGIKETDAGHEVKTIRDQLFSHEPEEHPAEIENVALKKRLANTDDELKAEKEQHQDTQNKLAEMEGMEAEWLEMDERRKAASKELTDTRAENAELKERLSETENRLKTIELESDAHIKTLMEQLRTVEAGKARLEKRPKNSPKQPETSIEEWRRKIWKQLCDHAAQKDTPVRFQKPGSAHYLNVSRSLIDLTGFYMVVWLGRDNREIGIRLYIPRQNFYILEKQRKEIEQKFCESLEWEELPQRTDSRISLRKGIIDPTDESDWQNQHEWVISKLEKFHKKFNEVFLPRIQELNTSDSLSEDEESLPLNPATPNSITFQDTTFTKDLDKYRVAGDDIAQTFWRYWHAQRREGKQEMRDAGWNVEKVDGNWEISISTADYQAWIENEGSTTQPTSSFHERTELPTGKEMEQPALELLADRREHRRVEIINRLTEYFSLTDDERSYLSKTGQSEKHLMNKGLIKRTRTGHYRITTRGLQVLRRTSDDVPF